MSETDDLTLYRGRVLAEWIDYNHHMNVAYYMVAFDLGTDALLDHIGLDQDFRERQHCSVFTLEAHVNYLRELKLDDPIHCNLQLLDHDAKRIHYFQRMYHSEQGYLAATTELILLHVDMDTRRSAPLAEPVRQRLDALWQQQRHLPRPPQAGSVIGIRR